MKQLDPKAIWLFFVRFATRWFFIILFAIVISFFQLRGGAGGIFRYMSPTIFWFIIVLALFFLSLFWAKLSYRFYRYELKESGFRKEHGVIWKKYVTIPYDRIQNVDIYRGLIARVLGLSDLHIQTAGGITMGSYGAYSEGRLPGLSREVAEQLRDELIERARRSKNQGL